AYTGRPQYRALYNNVTSLDPSPPPPLPGGEGSVERNRTVVQFRNCQREGEPMNRIVHLALKVEDLDRTAEFYQKVFGFKEVETKKVRDHSSRHLTDGVLDFALIKYDSGTQSAE